MEKILVKTKKQIKIMSEGGKKLSEIKGKLKGKLIEGVSAAQIEDLASTLISKSGGKASFKEVLGYSWATCVNINEGVVHGIPHKNIVFGKGDVVSVDVGLYYKGFHTDTSFSVAIKADRKTTDFLEDGVKVLEEAIDKARVGNRIYDISKTIQEGVEKNGFSVIRALVGHGIGRKLHEPPQIPCFVSGKREKTLEILNGAVLAIEVMYTMGGSDVKLAVDEWTIQTQDGKIAGLFEETVAVTTKGPKVLTKLPKMS